MNGLKMVWIISRHYKEGDKMQNLISLISDEIADKVESQIKIQKLFILRDDLPFEMQLEQTEQLIAAGDGILKSWKTHYKNTKADIEEQNLERWDFPVKPINERIEPMTGILSQLLQIADILKKFLVFLGPNLKAVTGNSEGIDNLVQEVKQLVIPIEQSPYNFFQRSNQNHWGQLYRKFQSQKLEIEQKTISLIDETFKTLRSSEGAFDLLQNFKNISTLDNISEKLQKKYSDVLSRYKIELETNQNLFENGKKIAEKRQEHLIISKNKPPVAGSISWAKSIFNRIKRPILKFLTKEETLDKQFFQDIKNEYKNLAKTIDQYQKDKFKDWNDRITERAMVFLKEKILEKVDDCHYRVNFSDEFKVLIKEAKQFEKMGYHILKTIINISLQEKEYYRYIDKLHIMLREYNEAVHTLSEIEKKLLEEQIKKLNRALEPGHESLNLSSLGIPDFI